MLIVSEQASEQVELADRSPGASTFPGPRTRGGWIPVMLKPKHGKPAQVDWICPVCNCLTGNYNTCPKCGLIVKTSPHVRDPLPKSKKVHHYKTWVLEIPGRNDDEKNEPVRCDYCGQIIKNTDFPCFCNCCGQRIL